MIISNKSIYIGSAIALTVVALAWFGIVKANPSQFYRNNPNTATTTVSYMTPGTATTTNTFNSQSDGSYIADTAVFTQCLNASSTATVLTTAFEYSYDGGTWFADNFATSSTAGPAIFVQQPTSYSWTFASTSINGSPANANFGCKIFALKTPTQYVRAVMSVTGAAGAIWSDFGAKREMR